MVKKKVPEKVAPYPLTEKEWRSANSRFSGFLKEAPKPLIRRYPNPYEKRPVTVKVSSWVGLSAGAVHTYVKVREEDNAVWLPAHEEELAPGRMIHNDDSWMCAWDDPEHYGRNFEKDVLHLKQAGPWLRKILKKNFPSDQYKVTYQEMDVSERRALRDFLRPGG